MNKPGRRKKTRTYRDAKVLHRAGIPESLEEDLGSGDCDVFSGNVRTMTQGRKKTTDWVRRMPAWWMSLQP